MAHRSSGRTGLVALLATLGVVATFEGTRGVVQGARQVVAGGGGRGLRLAGTVHGGGRRGARRGVSPSRVPVGEGGPAGPALRRAHAERPSHPRLRSRDPVGHRLTGDPGLPRDEDGGEDQLGGHEAPLEGVGRAGGAG